MKVRQGFISNSSSSSFILSTKNLTFHQIRGILHYEDFINEIKEKSPKEFDKYKDTLFEYYDGDYSGWDIKEDQEHEVIKAWTTMDNFDLYTYITDYLKVEKKEILMYEDNEHYWGSPFEKNEK